jgi:hypothetical protein
MALKARVERPERVHARPGPGGDQPSEPNLVEDFDDNDAGLDGDKLSLL